MDAITRGGLARSLAMHYAAQYGAIHPLILRQLLEWVLLMRQRFDGDLDMMIVLAVIGDRMLKEPTVKDHSYQQLLDRQPVLPEIPLVNRKSIADSTGIPRETVRRKVAALIARGWVTEQADGTLMPARGAATDLHDTTIRSFEILGQLAEVILTTHAEAKKDAH